MPLWIPCSLREIVRRPSLRVWDQEMTWFNTPVSMLIVTKPFRSGNSPMPVTLNDVWPEMFGSTGSSSEMARRTGGCC